MKWLLMALLSLVHGSAQAHTLSVAHLEVTVPATSGELEVGLDLALRDIALTLPLDGDRNEQITWGELIAIQPQLEALVLQNFSIASTAGDCELSPQSLATRKYDDGVYAHLGMRARCPSGQGLRVRYGLLFDVDPQHRVMITVHHGDTVATAIGRKGSSSLSLPSSGDSAALAFLGEGIHHILIGYDHLAFLISLLLPAALLRRDSQWQPAPGFRSSLLRVLGLVTAFTLAHSITLTLAALGWVTPASRWVEVAIAASVLLAALNNVWPVITRRLWLVAFGFGLIHGFGFAGALGELGLPEKDRLLALLAFNGGVELGQLAVVCVLLPVLFAFRHRAWYPRIVVPVVSLAIAALGAYWLMQRLAGN